MREAALREAALRRDDEEEREEEKFIDNIEMKRSPRQIPWRPPR